MSPLDQSDFTVRFEWGEHGVRALAATTDVLVIVDVLRFSTAVDVAVARGAAVLPFPFRDPVAAAAFAEREDAILAGQRRHDSTNADPGTVGYSLSPVSLAAIPPGTRLVLPSPNGSTLSRLAAEAGCTVFAGCLRNASAVAVAATAAAGRDADSTVGVIAAGERWGGDLTSLRPAIEDLVGAGAIISALPGRARSPEAELAAAAFRHVASDLPRCLETCSSGREPLELGFADDVRLAAQLDVSASVPVLSAGAFRAYA